MIDVPMPAPAAAFVGRKHSQILAAAVTFCLGLLVVRVVLGFWLPMRFAALSVGGDPLILLEAAAAAGTIMYVLLRGEEGDFRALFVVTLLFFLAQEGMSFIASAYGLLQFRVYALVVAFATTVYASLGVIAAAYDGDAPAEHSRRPLLAACGVIMALSAARSLTPTLGPSAGKLVDVCGILALIGMLVFLATWLFRQAPKPEPTAEAPAEHPGMERRGGIGQVEKPQP
ncbi:MAG: hypothetical protein KIS92_11925 [Planctomycetota bacterium]|nr:hypothetical protein [Planctomycetota bacterium]